jgi:hypothetical protein
MIRQIIIAQEKLILKYISTSPLAPLLLRRRGETKLQFGFPSPVYRRRARDEV